MTEDYIPEIKHYTAEDIAEMANDENWVAISPDYFTPEALEFAKNFVSDYDEDEFDLETEQKRLANRLEDLYLREAAKRAGKFKVAFAGLYK